MKQHLLQLDVENIRAIANAHIFIDGITVITGENGCGKSTISKLAYHIFETSIKFDNIISIKSNSEIFPIYRSLSFLLKEILPENNYLKLKIPSIFKFESEILIEQIHSLTAYLSSNDISENQQNRIKKIIESLFPLHELIANSELSVLLQKLETLVLEKQSQDEQFKITRPLSVLYDALEEIFYDNPLPDTFNIQEYQVPILDKEKERLLPIHSVQNVVYIDTPMLLGLSEIPERPHWEDLNFILQERRRSVKNKNIDVLFSETVLKGTTLFKKEDNIFTYQRNDGKEFNLIECATGLKSFAILQMLYKNGVLDKNTLLIIDEPEVHLHPQWVVEYARLMVLMNKFLGVKFLIASHHPDLISAIRYISEKEEVTETLNFYLAQQEENGFLYDYKHLGVDIEEIFASFNIALERIDLYGTTN